MKPIEIYIHIPFCIQKCRYCDFLSYAASEEVKKQYFEALLEEIRYHAKELSEYEVDTVFIGGGTPSCVDAKWIEQIMDCIRKYFTCHSLWEVSIEANPGTVTLDKLNSYRNAGINRISFGLQSSKDEELKILGRIHTYQEFLESFELARKAGFSNVNVDLMSALPKQDFASFKGTLHSVAQLEPEHLSVYSLIIEEGTEFYKNKDLLEKWLPSEDIEREMYAYTGAFLASCGYEKYEISNYAKKGFACRHNIGYWTRKDYAGFGLGAASCVQNQRFSNTSSIEEYIHTKRTGKWEEIRQDKHSLSKEEQMEETMFLGLRLMNGVGTDEFLNTFGISIGDVYGSVLAKGQKEGLLKVTDRIALTKKGIDVSNYVMAQFLF